MTMPAEDMGQQSTDPQRDPPARVDMMSEPGDACVVRYNLSVNDGNGVAPASGGGLMCLNAPLTGSFASGTFHFYNTFYNISGRMYVELWTGRWVPGDDFGIFTHNIFWCPRGFQTGIGNKGANDWGSGTMPFWYDHDFFYGTGNAPVGATNTITSAANQFVKPGSGTRDGYQLLGRSDCRGATGARVGGLVRR